MKLKDILNLEMMLPENGGYPEPTGSVTITTNGTHNVKDVAQAIVNVSGGGGGGGVETSIIELQTSDNQLTFDKTLEGKNFIVMLKAFPPEEFATSARNEICMMVNYNGNTSYAYYNGDGVRFDGRDVPFAVSANKITVSSPYSFSVWMRWIAYIW